jgi:hypothetical protein
MLLYVVVVVVIGGRELEDQEGDVIGTRATFNEGRGDERCCCRQ